MGRSRVHARSGGFFKQHSLSIVSIAVLLLWLVLYRGADPSTHLGSFFGNAVADWTGVVVAVIATKYFYEIGSAESRQPRGRYKSRVHELFRDHSLTIFLLITGSLWALLYVRVDSNGKWGQVVGNLVSEWTQLIGLVLFTKRLVEERSKESRK